MPASNIEASSLPDAVASRQDGHDNNRKKRTPRQGGEAAGTGTIIAEIKVQIAELIKTGVAELQQADSAPMRAIVEGLRHIEGLAANAATAVSKPAADDVHHCLREITQRLMAIEATTKKAIAPGRTLTPAYTASNASTPSATPSWSQIAAGGLQQRARIELRLEKRTDGTTETPEQQLERIQKAIPGAQAIITHPRSSEKISVLVSSTARRDQILQSGVEGLEGAKVIRRPRLVMISGVPIQETIKNRKCEENEEWIKKVQRRNPGLIIERVSWLYSDKNLHRRRTEGKQTKGSIILSMATEAMQHQVVRQGLLVGAEWHPARMWDVSLTDGQCFRCHQWGHSQSVCNAPKELCGHCAGSHSSKECKTRDDASASCAGCKQKGHKAWMTKKCKAHEAFRARNEAKKKEMVQATVMIQREGYYNSGRSSPAFQFGGSTSSESDWKTVESGNKRQRTIGRPSAIAKAGRDPSQSRLLHTRTAGTSTEAEDIFMSTQ